VPLPYALTARKWLPEGSARGENLVLLRRIHEPRETKNRKLRGELVEAAEVECEWAGILRTVRAGLLAVPSRVAASLPHLSKHDVSVIDAEVRAVLTELAGGNQLAPE
jgi:phage terminase Nu1 subunit (DNA packaging protein)